MANKPKTEGAASEGKRGIRAYIVTCIGLSPLLMDPMSDETLLGLITGKSVPIQKDRKFIDVAAEKIYRDPADGKTIGIPGDNLFACLVEGGKQVQFKKQQKVSNSDESLLPGLIDVVEQFLPLSNTDWIVDKRRGVLEATGGAVGIIRPKFDVWGFSCTIVVYEDFVNIEKIREVFDMAGRFKGLGGFRKKGRFGRFKVVKWEEIAVPQKYQPAVAA